MKVLLAALKDKDYQKCVFYGGVTLFAFAQMVISGDRFSNKVVTQRFLELFEEFQPGSAEKFVQFVLEKGAK